jgi:phosphoribulokinase
MAFHGRKQPVIIGVVGDSGAGKTTFAAGLADALGRQRTVSICIDDYHRYDRKQRAVNGLTPLDPACNYLDILEQHVYLLRAGEPVLKPVYNHSGGTLEPPEYVTPKDFIILEGMLGYTTPRLRDAYDVKFYLQPEEQLRLRWKFQRDAGYGGYTVEQVKASLDKLKRDSLLYVVPQRAFADMVISFYPPDDRPEEMTAALNVRHILRPTLPYLDLGPVLEVGADKGFELELARDTDDGRPVDALHIYGSLANGHAEAMEDYLSSLLSPPPQQPSRIGEYHDSSYTGHHSHVLALSQLMVTHYLLNAAVGAHAL